MWGLLKGVVLKFLRVPPEPADPLGAPGSLIVFRASPNFYKYKFAMWSIGTVIGGVVLLGMTIGLLVGGVVGLDKEPAVGVLMLLAAVVLFGFAIFQAVFSYATMRLDYEMRWYKVTDRSLRIREGVWHIREMTMTFDNIQNLEVTQGPIQRMLKIADLKVQTAGGGGNVVAQQGHQQQHVFNMHIGYFRGIDNAPDVMRLMQERLKRARGTGLGDQDDETESVVAASAPAGAGAAPTSVLSAAQALLEEARAFRRAAEAATRS